MCKNSIKIVDNFIVNAFSVACFHKWQAIIYTGMHAHTYINRQIRKTLQQIGNAGFVLLPGWKISPLTTANFTEHISDIYFHLGIESLWIRSTVVVMTTLTIFPCQFSCLSTELARSSY
jgi:hypothetical protein